MKATEETHRPLMQEVCLLNDDQEPIGHGIIVGRTIEKEPVYDIACTKGRIHRGIPEAKIDTSPVAHCASGNGFAMPMWR